MKINFLITLILIVIISCQTEKERVITDETSGMALLDQLSSAETGLDFLNSIDETLEINTFTYDGLLQGNGVAVLDFDNDGLQDIYFASTMGGDKLYRNTGNLKFEDVTKNAGIEQGKYYSTGISIVDINSDGYDDIYVNRFMHTDPVLRKNKFYINQKNGKFVDQVDQYGLGDTGFSVAASFFDYDGDNDLDVYIANQPPNDFFSKQRMKGKRDMQYTDRLYKNEGNKFTDVTQQAGITNYCYSLSANPVDYDKDGLVDIYVAADYEEPDLLYRNNGNGTFTNTANEAFRHISNFSMGTDISDINNDGLLDIFTVDMVAEDNFRQKTNMSGMNPEKFWKLANAGYHHQYMFNSLQLNNGNGTFSEIAQMSGISNTDWSWSPLFIDIDQDGLQDLLVTNGVFKEVRNKDYDNWRKDYFKKRQEEQIKAGAKNIQWDPLEVSNKAPSIKLSNYVYKNKGGLEFEKMNSNWKFDEPSWSSGSAYADFDNDGDLDIVINNTNMESFFYRNMANEEALNNYISFEMEGSDGNTKGYGTSIEITYANGEKQIAQVNPYRGYMSSSQAIVHFGLGATNMVDEVRVVWPDKKMAIYNSIKANTKIRLKYTDANANYRKTGTQTLFTKVEQSTPVVHKENEYNDYKDEILLPHKMSTLGPVIAIADVNGDGNDDFYLGGSAGNAGAIYLGSNNGQFSLDKTSDFTRDKSHEDGDAVFFDADGDGDLDLYIASGGNEKSMGDAFYQDRLYNNINGTFSKTRLPNMRGSNATVAAHDYDEDGDIDLFVGGRQIPGKYGYRPKSYFLENIKGSFQIAKEMDLGMVTDAVFANVNKDSQNELIIAGEWMPIQVWSYKKTWENISETSEITKTDGWWNTLRVEDMDGDGDMDILAGNLGLNIKFKASEEQPFKLYVDDFDGNGSNDVYLGYYASDGKCYPVRGRQCSSEQMPFVKKKFETYNDFGSATIVDVLNDKMTDNTVKEQVYTFKTSLLENNGSGKFNVHAFTNDMQKAPVHGFAIIDVNKDGKKDVFSAGNYYNREVETTRSDAGTGSLAIQQADKNYATIPVKEAGIFAYKDVRAVHELQAGGKKIVAVFNNNDAADFYKLN